MDDGHEILYGLWDGRSKGGAGTDNSVCLEFGMKSERQARKAAMDYDCSSVIYSHKVVGGNIVDERWIRDMR
jgi:hypothetical protein